MADEKKKVSGKKVGLTSDQNNGYIGEMIARHVVQLSEHVDSIQVIATKLEPDGTTTRFAYGSGDMYARAKAMETLLENMDEAFP